MPVARCVSSALDDLLQNYHPETHATVVALESFAERHGLPTQTLELGPVERPIERLFVPVDYTDQAMLADYLRTFNLDKALGPAQNGTLALEFEMESDGSYVSGVLRSGSNDLVGIWRTGIQESNSRQTWWDNVTKHDHLKGKPIKGFSHLIGLTPNERANVEHYLNSPADRGALKSDNCIAWLSSIEIGDTHPGATDDQRGYLFRELGMSRSIAHFEIGRRLIHAANEKHSAVVVFVEGKAGIEAFKKNLRDYLPPDPQIPYESVIAGLRFAEDAPVMKAIDVIPDGSKVFVPIASGASPEGVQALMQRAPSLKKGLDVHLLVNGVSEGMLSRGLERAKGMFRIHALFLGGNLRKLYKNGKVTIIPGALGDFARAMADPSQPAVP